MLHLNIVFYLFFFCLSVILYIYIGYPLLITILLPLRSKIIKKNNEYEPFVSILIPAYNEEECISATLNNKLSLDYPRDKLEIVVISDGSSDNTNKIVQEYADSGVLLLRQTSQSGKTVALNKAVPKTKGDIIVFSDANSIYAPDALKMLVRNFADPDVGYVSGKMIYTNGDGSAIGDGCSTYMKYENLLRSFETKVGSIVGVDGGIDAVRRELYQPMNADQLPDFILPLRVFDQGYRVVYEPEAILKEPALSNIHDEHKMRVRVTLRALWAIYDMRHLLSVKRYGLFSLQLWSHKVLRYLCFIFLLGAYVSNLALWNTHFFFKCFFLLQTTAYVGAILFPFLERSGTHFRLLYLLHYFVLVNLSAAFAFFKFLRGHKQIVWTPRKG